MTICYKKVRVFDEPLGPLNTGNDQVVIAAGEGAVAAIDINKRLLEIHEGG